MISKVFRAPKRIYKLATLASFNFSTAKKGGNLFTWGDQLAGLGYQPRDNVQDYETPRRINMFNNEVEKVVMGPKHTAVVTTNGELFTFGFGKALGHGRGNETLYTPKKVDFFSSKGLRVKDVAVGEDHTIAVTEDDLIWTWGSGSGNTNILVSLLLQTTGALGHGNNSDRTAPTCVEKLRDKGPFVSISAGNQFCFAVNKSGDVFGWGKGAKGVLGNGTFDNIALPTINEAFARLKAEEKVTVTKIISAGDCSVALLSNGKLKAWGFDTQGQLGVNADIANGYPEEYMVPEDVDLSNTGNKKVIDVKLSDNILVLLTEDNVLHYSGYRHYASPTNPGGKIQKKVKKIAASIDSFAAVTEDNKVHIFHDFMETDDSVLDNFYQVADTSAFEGEILDIGGAYKTRYAIVRE